MVASVTLTTADGLALEGELAIPDDTWSAAVLTHPHPLYGGDMRSVVPAALFDALPRAGVAALRFNFRGVAGSTGSHGGGEPERADVEAAAEHLAGAAPGVPLALVGWSFGADVALGVGPASVAGWVAVAPPLRTLPAAAVVPATDPRPALLLVPQHDQFCAPAQAEQVTASWTSTEVVTVGGADHFLLGRTDRVVEAVLAFLRRLTG